MQSFKLGSDVYLEFVVTVNSKPATIVRVTGELYRKDTWVQNFTVYHLGPKVKGNIPDDVFHSIGEYNAKFNVTLDNMGTQEYAIPFKITKSVLGKKRQSTTLV